MTVNNPANAGPSAPGGTSALASAPPEQQKIMLGEQLYPLVHRREPDKAAKITGMLLEMDNAEVLYLIENIDALNSKIDEAVQVNFILPIMFFQLCSNRVSNLA